MDRYKYKKRKFIFQYHQMSIYIKTRPPHEEGESIIYKGVLLNARSSKAHLLP